VGLENMRSSFGIKGKPLTKKTSIQNNIGKNGVINTQGTSQHQNKIQGTISPSGLNDINPQWDDSNDVEFDED
jgi:hypothetical protein